VLKKLAIFSILFIFAVSFSGCATARKQKDLEMQGLRNQVSALESQLQSKNEEINNLKETLSKTTQEKQVVITKKKIAGAVKSRPKVRHIQVALRNAGYDPGRIDGKMGKQTEEAIKAFQKANNLVVTGKSNKETWNLLKEYLYKKVK